MWWIFFAILTLSSPTYQSRNTYFTSTLKTVRSVYKELASVVFVVLFCIFMIERMYQWNCLDLGHFLVLFCLFCSVILLMICRDFLFLHSLKLAHLLISYRLLHNDLTRKKRILNALEMALSILKISVNQWDKESSFKNGSLRIAQIPYLHTEKRIN